MKNRPPAWLRYPAIFLLSVAFVIVFPVAWVMQRINGATLSTAESIKDALDALTDGSAA